MTRRDTSRTTETIDQDRRRLLGAATMGMAVAGAASLLPSRLAPASPGDAIRPFRINVPEEVLIDLRRRLAVTRWPDRETVADDSQGVPLATMQDLARYWATDHDWRKVEARLNALPQFMTEIDGLDIHFIHVRSKHENALPLIVTHGWPGSVVEQLKIIDPLTNPTAHGASAADAFHLVIPSMPGYGFSAKPTTSGWGPDRIARAWIVLMKRLGYTRFVAQGGDWGSPVSHQMAKLGDPDLIGIHVNLPGTIPPDVAKALQCGDPAPSDLSADERRAYEQIQVSFSRRRAYAQMMGTRPQTLYGIADSPIGLAAWLIDHGDGYGQPAAAITSALVGHTINGHPAGDLTRDDVLDDITLYWVTNSGVSSGRLYWENKLNLYAAADVSIPAAVTVFPGENYEAPRSWAERAYHQLIYYNKVDKGGHYAAWEQPQLFSEEVRAGFKSLRG
ncbi:MAG: alpha/beta fold hydrolase [Bradyrhizobium sp.]|uniref:epoxide hydrolase family protein n=1 Tax=Bradyrhizobium sp. TaxID=376 RepID=UPI001E00B4C2|nr:epoxide hydrolase family protein [Bradyrhizobium sp.]MBV9560406.1 alpha/beta fold hydrolase [Bradyrhizobium sp.]